MIFVIYLLLNYYVGLRSLQAFKAYCPSSKPLIFWIVFIVISMGYIWDRVFPLKFSLLKMVGSYWIAAFFYLLIFYFLLDVLELSNSTAKLFPLLEPYWQSKKIYLLVLLLTTVIIIIGSWLAHNPYIVKYGVQINNKSTDLQNIKLVMISDLHVETSSSSRYLEKAADKITSLHPDLILIAGDFAEGTLDPVTKDKLSQILSKLHARYGIYAVLGNHEYYGGESDGITEFLYSQDLTVLRDELTESIGGKIYIAGRHDYDSGRVLGGKRKPLAEILTGTDPSKPLILLDHQPRDISEAKQAGVDLMLSGHTHGGQLFPLQLTTKSLFIIDRGILQEEPFHLIVSTGLGVWGPPIRTNSRSEIVEIDLTFDKN